MLEAFISMYCVSVNLARLQQRQENPALRKIQNTEMFDILLAITQQIYERWTSTPTRLAKQSALRLLFQSALLVPEFDDVSEGQER